jgi:predicted enzyme related to lactoylglutathione lyase
MDNTVTWFEVATADPEGAQQFYGELFGWTFARMDGPIDYRGITFQGGEQPAGGLYNTKGEFPGHAVFHVQVADVEQKCRETESLGGKVVTKVVGGGGSTDFAYLQDSAGNMFGIFHSR